MLPITINVENVRMPTNITDEFKDKVQAAYTVGNCKGLDVLLVTVRLLHPHP